MLHYDGKSHIGVKLGVVACFTVFYRFFCLIKHVKIKIQNFEVGQNEENIALNFCHSPLRRVCACLLPSERSKVITRRRKKSNGNSPLS